MASYSHLHNTIPQSLSEPDNPPLPSKKPHTSHLPVIDVKGWPTQPGVLPCKGFMKLVAGIITDIINFLPSIAFLALAGLSYRLEGQQISSYGDILMRVMKIVGTIFHLGKAITNRIGDLYISNSFCYRNGEGHENHCALEVGKGLDSSCIVSLSNLILGPEAWR